MNSSGLPCSSPSPVVGPPPPAAGVGVVGAGAGCGGGAVKLKFCRYYAKDKTCFYGEECQFLHEEPGAASAGPGPAAPLGGLPLGIPPAAVVGPKKAEVGSGGGGGGGGGGGLDGPRLAIPGIDGGGLADASLTDSYFSTSFIGVNGFGNPAETKYPMMQRMTNSSSSPSLLNDSAKQYAGHDPLSSPNSSLFNDFAALSVSQRRKLAKPAFPSFITDLEDRYNTVLPPKYHLRSMNHVLRS